MLLNSNGSHPRLFSHWSLFLLLTLALNAPQAASGYELVIGAGPVGSMSHYVGKLFCRKLVKGQPDFSCTLDDSSDAVDHLTNVQGGSLDLAIIDSQLLAESQQNTGPFSFLDIGYDLIRVIAPLYSIPLSIVSHDNAGITTSEQLKGKRLNIGPPGSSEKKLFEMVMLAHGWTPGDFPVLGELSSSMSQDTIAFRQQRFQALLHRGVHPATPINQLLEESQTSLIGFSGEPVSDLLAENPALSVVTIPGGTYHRIKQDIYTFGTTMTLIASADLDGETARAIGAALITEEAVLRTMHPSLSSFSMTVKRDYFGGVEVHPVILQTVQMR
jgi:TRAP transporter TAXI family solute receptor